MLNTEKYTITLFNFPSHLLVQNVLANLWQEFAYQIYKEKSTYLSATMTVGILSCQENSSCDPANQYCLVITSIRNPLYFPDKDEYQKTVTSIIKMIADYAGTDFYTIDVTNSYYSHFKIIK